MADATQTNRASEFIISECGSICYEQITVVSGQNLKAGEVVGIITASGKVASYDNDAVDGKEIAVGLIYEDCDATAGDTQATILTRLAEVSKDKIIWGAAVTTQAEKDAAYADLNARFVIVRA